MMEFIKMNKDPVHKTTFLKLDNLNLTLLLLYSGTRLIQHERQIFCRNNTLYWDKQSKKKINMKMKV